MSCRHAARALYFQAVIVFGYKDVVSSEAPLPVTHGIDDALDPGELRILRIGVEAAVALQRVRPTNPR